MKKAFILIICALAAVSCSKMPKVTVTEDAETFTLSNGTVAARVSKVTGDLVSFRYMDREMFATKLTPEDIIAPVQDTVDADSPNWMAPTIKGKAHGYWSHDAMGIPGSAKAEASVTINPKKNGGRRGEVSVKAISGGRLMGTGPGTNPSKGDVAVDIDIRYTLEQGDSGVYTYCTFTHRADYPAGEFTEARYCTKLAETFDWMSVDKNVDFYYPKDHNAGDKYVYTAPQDRNPAFGWSSTTDGIGLFFINPSMEYMSGGPTKVEFMGHRNTSMEAEGCVLNYWRSSHYGGAEVALAEGEEWVKTVGPFLIYANSGDGHDAIYADAKSRAEAEHAKWPYSWVGGADYPTQKERATVTGRLMLNDPASGQTFSNLNVGLAHAEYESASSGQPVDWQRDAKHYQFWTIGNSDGDFTIEDVRPGEYTLYAYADGILGEYRKTDITVSKGERLNLGELTWTPVRYGKQIFQIGTPDRSPMEFAGADMHRDPEIVLKYAEMFPNDVSFNTETGDCSKEWFFMQVPHNENPDAKPLPFFGIVSSGRATPFRITFNLDSIDSDKATLRMALVGTSAKSLGMEINGRNVGKWSLSPLNDSVIVSHGSHGIWHEETFTFRTSLLHEGENTIVITVPEGSLNSGIMFDCLRLEI